MFGSTSVIALEISTLERDLAQPWIKERKRYHASACVISNDTFLTAAHVVANAIRIVASAPDRKPTGLCDIVHLDSDRELVLLRLKPGHSLGELDACAIGEHPVIGDDVEIAYVRPDGTSIREASRVERIEVGAASYSERPILMMRLTLSSREAATSGSAVFREGRLVGLGFQASTGETSPTLDAIPASCLARFLVDADQQRLPGLPELGVHWQKTLHPALRDHLEIPSDGLGILVTRVVVGSSAHHVLLVDDVIVGIDGHDVYSDATCTLSTSQRVSFIHLINQHNIGDVVAVTVIRRRQRHTLSLQLAPMVSLVPLPSQLGDTAYVIFAGFVFRQLTHSYIKMWGWNESPYTYRNDYHRGEVTASRRGIVIISRIVSTSATHGYERMGGTPVTRVNGQTISTLAELTEAFKTPDGGHHLIEIENHNQRNEIHPTGDFGYLIVLDAALADQATRETLEIVGATEASSD